MKKQDRVGIDVSARSLEVCLERGGKRRRLEVANDDEGHRKLVRLLSKGGRSARVALEATGVYHLDLARALQAHARIEVMVVNPAVMRDFARALVQRSKTDVDDAEVGLEFVSRMPFTSWESPPQALFDLRALSRRISGLIDVTVAEQNRLHAVKRQAGTPPRRGRGPARAHRVPRATDRAAGAGGEEGDPWRGLSPAALRAAAQRARDRGAERDPHPRRARRIAQRHEGPPVGGPRRPRSPSLRVRDLGPPPHPDQSKGKRQAPGRAVHAGPGGDPARPPHPGLLRSPSSPRERQSGRRSRP